MKPLRIFLLVLYFSLSGANAEDPRLENVLMARPMKNIPTDLIKQQLAHIKKIYPELKVDLPLPTFKVATQAYMTDLYKRLTGLEGNIVSLYIHQIQDPITKEITRDRTIYLSIQWSPDTIEYRGDLYHELIHYVQFMNNLDGAVACYNVLEFQAYEAAATYFIEVEKLPQTHEMVVDARSMAVMEGICPQKR